MRHTKPTSTYAPREALVILSRAIAVDVKKNDRAKFEGLLGCAVNACLVLAGVRPAARLEYYTKPGRPHVDTEFFREILRIAAALRRATGRRLEVVNFGGHGIEPLLVDTDRADPRDVATLRASVGGDLVEPLVSAMGRTLGYRCPFDPVRDSHNVRLGVRIEGCIVGDGSSSFLAAFGCAGKRRAEREHAVLVRDWLAPAARALAGTIVEGPGGRTYVVAGFELDVGLAR